MMRGLDKFPFIGLPSSPHPSPVQFILPLLKFNSDVEILSGSPRFSRDKDEKLKIVFLLTKNKLRLKNFWMI